MVLTCEEQVAISPKAGHASRGLLEKFNERPESDNTFVALKVLRKIRLESYEYQDSRYLVSGALSVGHDFTQILPHDLLRVKSEVFTVVFHMDTDRVIVTRVVQRRQLELRNSIAGLHRVLMRQV